MKFFFWGGAGFYVFVCKGSVGKGEGFFFGGEQVFMFLFAKVRLVRVKVFFWGVDYYSLPENEGCCSN